MRLGVSGCCCGGCNEGGMELGDTSLSHLVELIVTAPSVDGTSAFVSFVRAIVLGMRASVSLACRASSSSNKKVARQSERKIAFCS